MKKTHVEPTLGRVLLYHPRNGSGIQAQLIEERPTCMAFVCGVEDPRTVNLLVIGKSGSFHRQLNVPLVHSSDELSEDQARGALEWCRWPDIEPTGPPLAIDQALAGEVDMLRTRLESLEADTVRKSEVAVAADGSLTTGNPVIREEDVDRDTLEVVSKDAPSS